MWCSMLKILLSLSFYVMLPRQLYGDNQERVTVVWDFKLKMLRLIIFSVVLCGRIHAQLTASVPLQCADDENVNSFYHAPARVVPLPRVDPEIKRGFLELFHRITNPNHVHGDPHDAVTADTCRPSVIDPAVLAQINELCPRLAFFYSFAPRHVMASTLLQRQFMNQTTPADVLRLARALLYRHEVNPRLWYYALNNIILMRPDLNGYHLASAVDATPDLYITGSVLEMATRGSIRPPPLTTARQCRTANGVSVIDLRHQLPGGTSAQQPQSNCTVNGTMEGRNQQRPLLNTRSQNLPLSVQPQNPNFITFHPHDIRKAVGVHFGYRRKKRSTKANEVKVDEEQSDKLNRGKRQAGKCILYNGTTGATGEENRLWYFREDMMVNQHHWYWHQYFPLSSIRHPDRRGEAFYFTHHNIIARYNAERLSNGLPQEQPLDLRLGGNIGEGYNSDIVDSASGRFWTPRPNNTPLNNILHTRDRDFQLDVTMADLTQLYNNLTLHIAQGFLLANRSNNVFTLNIRNKEGMEHLANTIEGAEELATHAQFYNQNGVHNLAHIAIGLSTDPDFRCELPTGVMADLTVTMRDPAFYKIHSLVDVMFHRYKNTLPPYQLEGGEWPLRWEGVRITSLEVVARNRVNYLRTFWSMKRFPLEEGIDGFIHDGDVNVDICHQHLNYDPFTFLLTIDVKSCVRTVSRRGTVRIFMAPRYDLDGRRFTMDETRKLMFQLDSFPVELRGGRNMITRNSQDSSSTRPWSRNLQEMLRDPDNGGQTEYCGCGWPRHLYIPKGSPEGMEFDVFAIVTNFDEDQVLNTNADLNIQEPCHSPHLFCGVPYRRYPDARPMGYPFDREPYSFMNNSGSLMRSVRDLEEYVTNVNNAKCSVLKVQHFNEVGL